MPLLERIADDGAALDRAWRRLEPLRLYARPPERVRLLACPLFFALPPFRRFQGYAFRRTALFRETRPSPELVAHELCHLWQARNRPVRVFVTWLLWPYERNPYEQEARRAVAGLR
jgi:hypothetical protein